MTAQGPGARAARAALGRGAATFDRAYFDKWYRDPRTRVRTLGERERQVRFALAAAEQFLERPVRTVLDVGAGEGHWQPVLQKLRPAIRYTGVDVSEHAVRRHGAGRNIRLGSIEDLGTMRLGDDFDLVLCVGMLYYLTPGQFTRGVTQLHDRCAGMAYLEIFAREDALTGDVPAGTMRPAAWFRAAMRAARWLPLGMHCWTPTAMRRQAAVMELGW